MSKRAGTRFAGLIGLLCALASAAHATPLTYTVIPSESNLMVRTNIQSSLDLNPDPTGDIPLGDEFPINSGLTAFSNTQPSFQSTVRADVGIGSPQGFDNGANGIDFDILKIHAFNAPGEMSGSALIPTPLDPLGAPILLVTFAATVSSLQIVLNTPFSSLLAPSATPGEWLWQGVADVTISGTVSPNLTAQLNLPVQPPPVPFSQNVQLPLFGTFQEVAPNGGTRVTVGIDEGVLHNQDLSLPPIHQEIDLLGLGLITLELDLSALVLADISSSVVYQSAIPIPEPGTALLVGIGLVGLALRRRR